MKLLILHLSDLHIKTDSDAILARSEKIVQAIQNVETDVDAAVCVISGDIVYSGTQDQYSLAADFFENLKSGFEKACTSLKIKFVSTPGNHDCNFSESGRIRETILSAVLGEPNLLKDRSYSDICSEPLSLYFSFIETLDMLPLVGQTEDFTKVLTEYSLDLEGERVSFICANTALTSQLREQPGSLVYPVELIPDKVQNSSLAIAVYHHPVNWLKPECSRVFRDKTNAMSDIILTGHEHVSDSRKIISNTVEVSYIEGAALQDSENPDESSFNLVIVDTTSQKRRHLVFGWSGDKYIPDNGADPDQYYLWEDYRPNAARLRETFRLKDSFSDFLEDPEVNLTHRIKGQLKLSDIFVFPDLKRFNRPGSKLKSDTVRGNEVLELVNGKPRLFIVGDDRSGKTALAKQVFVHLRENGNIPVYLDAGRQRLTLGDLSCDIERAYLSIYHQDSLDAFRQCERAKRVLIIDNYHKVKIRERDKYELLEKIQDQIHRIVILAHDTALTIQDVAQFSIDPESDLPFEYFGIRQFSLQQQNRVIEKWLMLDTDLYSDTARFIHNVENLRRIMNTVFGKNYVPSFPPYILSILQATESGTELDLKANTHGYFYELFIKQTIARYSQSAVAVNILTAYLSHLAYEMYKRQSTELSVVDLKKMHRELQERFEVLGGFEKQIEQLEKMQLVVPSSDVYVFKHPYIFYYFLAHYLHDNLDNPEVHSAINSMTSELYREQSASTLLFLSHLTKDVRVLETLLAACDEQYNNVSGADLESDIQFLNTLKNEIPSIEMEIVPLDETRKRELERQDADLAQEIDYEERNKQEIEAHDTMIGKLNAALKTIQILGQYLKNFPANLERDRKDQIITACCNLGSRALGAYLDLVRENQSEFLVDMARIISTKKEGLPKYKIEERATAALVTLSELASYGMISRLSYALGSQELAQTHERYFSTSETSFYKLIYSAIRLDNCSSFPEALIIKEAKILHDNPFVFRILQAFVAKHFFMFPVDFSIRQRISRFLKLDYKKVSTPKPEQRLVDTEN